METVSVAAGLTWYAGSVLPFASLWHTVMRVAALNALRPRELPYTAAFDRTARPNVFAPVDLLFNETKTCREDAISIPVLAKWLGEPEEAFAWAHLGCLPPDLRFVLTPGPRLCAECIACGYHSALFSVRLLEKCPIHGSVLHSRCVCGRSLDALMTAGMLARTGHCVCGRVALMPAETCRRPTLAMIEAAALQPVVAWLQALSRVGVPRFPDPDLSSRIQSRWLDHVRDWCDVHELGYPTCFMDHPKRADLRIVATTGAVARSSPAAGRRRARQPTAAERQWSDEFKYWHDTPAICAYRGMLRHLRRHVTRRADRFARGFLQHPDPLQMATTMRDFPAAKAAFAELVWCLRLESNVLWRRWPYRRIVRRPDGDRFCDIAVAQASPSLDRLGRVVQPESDWSAYQASRAMLLAQWREAQRLANQAVRDGVADWRQTPAEDEFRWSTVAVDGHIRFVCMEGQGLEDWTLPLPNKARRRHEHDAQLLRRLLGIKDSCSGVCLTRDEGGEWQVVDALPPLHARVDRHRLLGMGRERPRFWLYEAVGGFVARACDVKVQALASSPGDAIEGLRQAMSRYKRSYPVERRVQNNRPEESQSSHDRTDRNYEGLIHWTLQDFGFQRGADLFWKAADAKLRQRQKAEVVHTQAVARTHL